MDAPRQLAQLGERLLELLEGGVEELRAFGIGRFGAGEAQLQGERHQLLLGAVVEIALQAPALGVGDLDDAGARIAQLIEPGSQVGAQALVLELEHGGRAGRLDDVGVGQIGAVDDRRDQLAVVLDGRPDPARCRRRRDLNLVPLVVDEDLALGQPVGDRE